MNRFISLALILIVFSSHALANPVVDKAAVLAISDEMTAATKNGDMAVFEKYLYPGTRIVVDMDPTNSGGQIEISYEDYIALIEMALGAMENAQIHDELISVSVDEAKNEATVEQKTTALLEMLGVKMRDVSISKTTYGVVDGRIKVLYAEDQLISSGPVE